MSDVRQQFPDATIKAASTAAVAADPALVVALSPNNEVGNIELPAAATLGDGTSNPTTTNIEALNGLFNGTSWDRWTCNMLKVLTGDTGTKTTSFAGATQTNRSARGAIITARFGTVSGTTPTCTAQLQFSPDDGTTWISLGAATGTATATNNTLALIIYPGATGATSGATQTVTINAPLPRTWRINYTIAGTTPSFALTETDVSYCK